MSELGDADEEFLNAHEKRAAEGRAYRETLQRKSALIGFANTVMRTLLEKLPLAVDREYIARTAFEIADAMLVELEKYT